MNLRRTVQDLQQQLQAREEETEFLKRKMKITKLNEYEVEVETMKEHMLRMRKIIKEQKERIKGMEA